MSLVMIHNGLMSCDMSSSTLDGEPVLGETKNKLYVSEDNAFAAGVTGWIFPEEKWRAFRLIIEFYIEEQKNSMKQAVEITKNAAKAFFKDCPLHATHVYFISGAFFGRFSYDEGHITIDQLDPKLPIMMGTAKFAAQVLVESGKNLDLTTFYDYVSQSVPNVTREYVVVDLATIVGSFWWEEDQLDIKDNLAKASAILEARKKRSPRRKKS